MLIFNNEGKSRVKHNRQNIGRSIRKTTRNKFVDLTGKPSTQKQTVGVAVQED